MVIIMKKIVLCAYVNGNLGDDLLIKNICERYSNVTFIVFGDYQYKNYFKNISNLIYHCEYKKNIYFKIKNEIHKIKVGITSDAIVDIGGSIFIETVAWKTTLIKRYFLHLNKNKFLIGANFGPYYSKSYLMKYKKYFKSYTDICFREKYSFDLFKDLDNVRYETDVIFGLEYEEIKDKGYYIFSLIDLENREDLKNFKDDYICKMVQIIERLKKNIVLFAFCQVEGDEKIIDQIMEKLPVSFRKNITIYIHDDIETSIKYLANAKGILATRFHAMIIGNLFEKNIYTLVYSNKTLNLIQDADLGEDWINITEIKDLDIDMCCNVLETKISPKINHLNELTKSANKQFKALDAFINEEEK